MYSSLNFESNLCDLSLNTLPNPNRSSTHKLLLLLRSARDFWRRSVVDTCYRFEAESTQRLTHAAATSYSICTCQLPCDQFWHQQVSTLGKSKCSQRPASTDNRNHCRRKIVWRDLSSHRAATGYGRDGCRHRAGTVTFGVSVSAGI